MYCDKCNNEVQQLTSMPDTITAYAGEFPVARFYKGEVQLCDKCLEKLESLHMDIKDFMTMSDEDIELALYTFKVGDQVITADGRVGTITEICTCERCKERGFYEPRIETEVGLYDIWITDTDKKNGFISYYKIGDRVFGNVDEKQIDVLKEDIHTRKHEIIALEAQLNVLETLKKEKEND